MSYMVDKPPTEDKIMQRQLRAWEPKEHRPTLTWSRSGFKTYSTYVCSFRMCWALLTKRLVPRPSTRRGFRLLRRASKLLGASFHYSLEGYIAPMHTDVFPPTTEKIESMRVEIGYVRKRSRTQLMVNAELPIALFLDLRQ